MYTESKTQTRIPTTGGSRALFTIDWYMNGRPLLSKHDDKSLLLKPMPSHWINNQVK